MQYREYDSIPLKLFAKLLYDETKIHLLGVPEKEQKQVWENIKEEYNTKHPSKDEISIVSAHKKLQLSSIRINKLNILLVLIHEETKEIEKLFQDSGFIWKESKEKRFKYLSKEIIKEKQKLQIYKAQYKKLEESIKNKSQKEKTKVTIEQINDGLASLESNGIPIGDYDKITCGRYDSLTKMIVKKANQK